MEALLRGHRRRLARCDGVLGACSVAPGLHPATDQVACAAIRSSSSGLEMGFAASPVIGSATLAS